MATIKVNSVTCVRLQDSVGPDEFKVYIGGVEMAGPFGIRKGQTVKLNTAPKTFTGATTIQLREMDGNNYTSLGLRAIGDSPVNSVSVNFDAAKNAFYTVNYTVA
jgi:hypothetical protein